MPNQMSQFWMTSQLGFSSSSSLQTLSQFDSTRGRITGLTYKMDALYVNALLKSHLMDVWIGAQFFFLSLFFFCNLSNFADKWYIIVWNMSAS